VLNGGGEGVWVQEGNRRNELLGVHKNRLIWREEGGREGSIRARFTVITRLIAPPKAAIRLEEIAMRIAILFFIEAIGSVFC
jgi:hypothetical protein